MGVGALVGDFWIRGWEVFGRREEFERSAVDAEGDLDLRFFGDAVDLGGAARGRRIGTGIRIGVGIG